MTLLETLDVDRCAHCGSSDHRQVAVARDFEYECCSNEFRFARCSSCGLVWLRDRPVPSAVPVLYSSEYSAFHYAEHLGGVINAARNRVQVRKISPLRQRVRPGGLVVDVGCGAGDYLDLVRRHGDPGWRVLGVDVADDAMRHLAARGIEGRRGDLATMAWDAGPVSAFVLNQCLEHVAEPHAALRRIRDLLEPGGVVVVETPSLDGWDRALFGRRHWAGWHTPRHWHVFDERLLREAMAGAGLDVVEVTYLLNPWAWLHSVRYWLKDRLRRPGLARWFDVDVLPMVVLACGVDVVQKLVRRRTSNIRVVGRRPASSS